MTEVYINQQRVFFKEDTKLKLTIENTFFEDAGSYTLEVVFPLDIEQNRKVFGVINRMEVTKRYQKYDALITVDSKLVFKGSAKITNISETEVKLQFLSGNSNVKFWTKAQKLYIDEFHYEYTDTNHSFDGFVKDEESYGTPLIEAGSFPGRKGIYCYVPTTDEAGSISPRNKSRGVWNEQHLMINKYEQSALYHGEVVSPKGYYIEMFRECISPNLMFVTRWIFSHLGYTIARNDIESEFLNSIYIANARNTTTYTSHDGGRINSADEMSMAKALPHWTVEEFISQLQNFLNVKIIFNDIDGTVDIINTNYNEGIVDITDVTQDEYEVEIIDDEDAGSNLYDSNVKYKKGTSEYHVIDLVEREVIDSFHEVVCTYEEFLTQWDSMSANDKKTTVWTTERGQYCAKVSGEGNQEKLERLHFNHFGSIVRNKENDNDIEIKISPVAMTTDIDMYVFEWDGRKDRSMEPKWDCKQVVLCLQNQYGAANNSTVWDAINGTKVEESEKEDIMQVFLMDDKEVPTGFYHLTYQMPFTHWDLNRPVDSVEHKRWSLSLTNDNSAYNIGMLHLSSLRQNRNAEHRFMFTADSIPSVYNIYLLRNKKYVCKKLEVQLNSKGMENEITGYFEEILEG